MKYVGATDWFIRWPFLLEGVVLGFFGGVIAGAFAFEMMREVFADITKYWQLLMGGVIVAVVLFLPGGLAGIPGRIKRAMQGGDSK